MTKSDKKIIVTVTGLGGGAVCLGLLSRGHWIAAFVLAVVLVVLTWSAVRNPRPTRR